MSEENRKKAAQSQKAPYRSHTNEIFYISFPKHDIISIKGEYILFIQNIKNRTSAT